MSGGEIIIDYEAESYGVFKVETVHESDGSLIYGKSTGE